MKTSTDSVNRVVSEAAVPNVILVVVNINNEMDLHLLTSKYSIEEIRRWFDVPRVLEEKLEEHLGNTVTCLPMPNQRYAIIAGGSQGDEFLISDSQGSSYERAFSLIADMQRTVVRNRVLTVELRSRTITLFKVTGTSATVESFLKRDDVVSEGATIDSNVKVGKSDRWHVGKTERGYMLVTDPENAPDPYVTPSHKDLETMGWLLRMLHHVICCPSTADAVMNPLPIEYLSRFVSLPFHAQVRLINEWIAPGLSKREVSILTQQNLAMPAEHQPFNETLSKASRWDVERLKLAIDGEEYDAANCASCTNPKGCPYSSDLQRFKQDTMGRRASKHHAGPSCAHPMEARLEDDQDGDVETVFDAASAAEARFFQSYPNC